MVGAQRGAGLQFSDDDLEAAVAAGAISSETAAGLRVFVERRRAAPAADEESFRLLTGFNDIFVSIALVIALTALGWLAGQFAAQASGAAVAAASWALAEFFTRRRRMALPSILLLFAFVGGVVSCAFTLLPTLFDATETVSRTLAAGALGALAAYLHWLRFKVPVTVAAGALTVGATAVAAIESHFDSQMVTLYAILAAGLIVFAIALAWDASDRLRKTRRADVAFWLHLLAAPAIVHSAFALLGVTGLSAQAPIFAARAGVAPDPHVLIGAFTAVAVYAALALVALVVDRRALMVSGLLYLIYAMNAALRATGALTLSFALSALIVGAALLLLSAFWASARRGALRLVPTHWRARLPPAA
jgi:hypothetical protein